MKSINFHGHQTSTLQLIMQNNSHCIMLSIVMYVLYTYFIAIYLFNLFVYLQKHSNCHFSVPVAVGEFQWHQWENVLAAARWLCIGRQQETRWRPSQWTLIRNGCQWSRSSPDITSQVTSNTVQRVKRGQNCQRWSKQIIKLYNTGHDIYNLVM